MVLADVHENALNGEDSDFLLFCCELEKPWTEPGVRLSQAPVDIVKRPKMLMKHHRISQTLHVWHIYLHWGGLGVNVGIYGSPIECLGMGIRWKEVNRMRLFFVFFHPFEKSRNAEQWPDSLPHGQGRMV